MSVLVDVKKALNTFYNFKFENLEDEAPTEGLNTFLLTMKELLVHSLNKLKCFKFYIIATGIFKVLSIISHLMEINVLMIRCMHNCHIPHTLEIHQPYDITKLCHIL